MNLNTNKSSNDVQKQRPGKLLCCSSIRLQTLPAQHIFVGKKIGVLRFSAFVLRIWKAAANDDPYADLFLMRIYEALVKVRRVIQENASSYSKLLKSVDGVNIEPFVSGSAKQYPLKFSNPYSFMSAYMVADYDRFIRVLLSAKYMLLIDAEEYRARVSTMQRLLRQALAMPLLWKNTGVTRYDVRHNTQVSQRANILMGGLNNEVLIGALRSPFAPNITTISREERCACSIHAYKKY